MDKRELQVGDLIAFQIGERRDFSAPNKDSWGVVKVIDLGDESDGSFSVSVKSGIWKNIPNQLQACASPLLVERRFEKLGGQLKPEPLVFTTPFDCVIDLLEARIIGREFKFSSFEEDARRKISRDGHCHRISSIHHAPNSIDHEHRAEFDEDCWKAEIRAYSERQDRVRYEREMREKRRLKHVTLHSLREESQFEDWRGRSQIVPLEFALGVQKRSNEVIDKLAALGIKPRRADVRNVLKEFVFWLNSFNGSFEYTIETEEREDLLVFVEELCWATKQSQIFPEVDGWRDW